MSARYQTLLGDQAFGPPEGSSSGSNPLMASIDSVGLETLFGEDVHLFNNSENPGNPFYSPAAATMNMSGLNVDQAEVGRWWNAARLTFSAMSPLLFFVGCGWCWCCLSVGGYYCLLLAVLMLMGFIAKLESPDLAPMLPQAQPFS